MCVLSPFFYRYCCCWWTICVGVLFLSPFLCLGGGGVVLDLSFVLLFSSTYFHSSLLFLSVPPANGAESSISPYMSVPLSVLLSNTPSSTKKRQALTVASTCSLSTAVLSSTTVATKKPQHQDRKSKKPSVHTCNHTHLKHLGYTPAIPPADNQCRQCQIASTTTNRLTCKYQLPH